MGGFLAFLITLIAGGVVIHSESQKENESNENKYNAIKNNEHWYWGGDNKMHATSTDEVIHQTFMEGHTQYVGVLTNRVYYDTIWKVNNELAAKGKKYIMLELYDAPGQSWNHHLWKWDIEKNMPFKTIHVFSNSYLLPSRLSEEEHIIVEYYPTINKYGVRVHDQSLNKKFYRSQPEYDYYSDFGGLV